MDSLNTILNSGTYGENVLRHNDNNSKIKQAITTLENVAIANKGYFDTLASLQAAFPSPKAGNIAYVANVASSTGYYIYNVVSGAWTATSTEAPAVGVAISNYAQHGYSSSPKTLKQVDDEVVQLAVDLQLKFTNRVSNGNFVSGLTNWQKSVYTGDAVVADNAVTISNGTFYYFGICQNLNLTAGRKYYVKFKISSASFEKTSVIRILGLNHTTDGQLTYFNTSGLANNQWHTLSKIVSPAANSSVFTLAAQAVGATTAVSIRITDVVVIDITDSFGAGNELNSLQMDALMKSTSFFSGDVYMSTKDAVGFQKEISNAQDVRIKALEDDLVKGMEISPRLAQMMSHDFIFSIGYDDASASIYNHAFQVHQAHDVPATFFVTTGIMEGLKGGTYFGGNVTWDQLREMQNSSVGKIIVGAHSHMHIDYGLSTTAQLHADIEAMMEVFLREGLRPKCFSYPGGQSSILAQQYISSYFHAARGANVHDGFNVGSNWIDANRYYTDSVSIDAPSVQNIKDIILFAKSNSYKVWLDMFMHAVVPVEINPGGLKTPEQLSEIIQFVKDNNGLIVSYDEAVSLFMEYHYWHSNSLLKIK